MKRKLKGTYKMKKFKVTVNGKAYEVEVEEVGGDLSVNQTAVPTAPAAPTAPTVPATSAAPATPVAQELDADAEQITAPMPGTILKVNAAAGQDVKEGDVLLVLEAMKMENDILAPRDGKVVNLAVETGSSVNAGDLLVALK